MEKFKDDLPNLNVNFFLNAVVVNSQVTVKEYGCILFNAVRRGDILIFETGRHSIVLEANLKDRR